jgi:hypothetical protein
MSEGCEFISVTAYEDRTKKYLKKIQRAN